MNKKTIKPIKNSIKPSEKYFEGLGRRKRAVARVRISKGEGKIYLNNKENNSLNTTITDIFELMGLKEKFSIHIHSFGGGVKSQIGAIKLGIARALLKYDSSLKSTLRKVNLLTRDPREKERKKPGLKGARRAPQWQKR